MSKVTQFVSNATSNLSFRVGAAVSAVCFIPLLVLSIVSYQFIWQHHLKHIESELNAHIALVQSHIDNEVSNIWLTLQNVANAVGVKNILSNRPSEKIDLQLEQHLSSLGPTKNSYLQFRVYNANARPILSTLQNLPEFSQQQFEQIQGMLNDSTRSAFIVEQNGRSLAVFSIPLFANSRHPNSPNDSDHTPDGFIQVTLNPNEFYQSILSRHSGHLNPQILFTDERGNVNVSNLADTGIKTIEPQQLSTLFQQPDASLAQITLNGQEYGVVLAHFINRQLIIAATASGQLPEYQKQLILVLAISSMSLLLIIFVSCFVLLRSQYHKRMASLQRLVALFDRQELVLSSPPKIKRDEIDELKSDLLNLAEKLLYRRQRLRALAFTDTLTQLTNRSGFIRDINSLITNSENQARNFSLLFIDLDGFKYINDSFGHDIGDHVLKIVAQNFERELKQVVTRLNSKYIQLETTHLYRLGGDEFTIVLEQYHGKDAILSVCDAMLQSFDQRIVVAEHSFKLSCSIGIANYPEHGDSREKLLQHADIAMYVAKDAGRNNYMVFNHQMLEQEQRRNLIRDSFSSALSKNELECNLQGLYNTQSLEAVGFEILMRWKHSKLGYISPMEFIPLLEETEHIHIWGQWIAQRAFEIAYAINQQGREMSVSINVAIAQLAQGDFVAFVSKLQQQFPIPSDNICFEITESTVTDCGPKALTQIHKLRSLGYHIAIDDFGTGLSSLARLQQLPITILKIDRSFIQGLTRDETSAAIVRTTLALAQSMQLKTIAEGVEETEHIQWFQRTGCEYLQGYALQKPCSEQEFVKSLANSPSNPER